MNSIQFVQAIGACACSDSWRSMCSRDQAIAFSFSNLDVKAACLSSSIRLPKARSSRPSPICNTIAPCREPLRTEESTSAVPAAAMKLSFLLVCDAFNSMTKRTFLKLQENGHQVIVHEWKDGDTMIATVDCFEPDVILCPFLTKRIPEAIYNGTVPCLVIHPGIEGDRGMSSIDWALQESQEEWGVTILQAEEEMDAGPIWATKNFRISRDFGESPTKSSLYRIDCVDAAMKCLDEVLHNLKYDIAPRPLDYTNPCVRGSLRPRMMQADRRLDWNLPADELAGIIRASDSQPGTQSVIAGEKYLLFGAHVERNPPKLHPGSAPMDLLGQRDGAVLIRCGEGTTLWITHLKKTVKSIKLPAVMVLPTSLLETLPRLGDPEMEIPMRSWPQTFQEIFYWTQNGVTYLWFDFYNGAMNTDQCRRLAQALDHIDQVCDSQVLVLMGGINYFSNGIHLNTIEAATDSAQETWENINAIDDVVLRILNCNKRVTVSAFLGSAGAGGVMAAIAADIVWAHGNVVLHPSYKAMELYGSEYWTYSLPKRVGFKIAGQFVNSTDPVSASQAKKVGLIDDILSASSVGFVESVIERAEKLARGRQCDLKIAEKKKQLPLLQGQLQQHRHDELVQMKKCFASDDYNRKRQEFVLKMAGTMPCQVDLMPVKAQGAMLKRTDVLISR